MEVTNAITKIANNVIRANPISADDYIQDGLIYCGKCNTPKQCKEKLFGNDVILPIICECQKAEFDRRLEQEAQIRLEEHIRRLRSECFPKGSMYHQDTFDKADVNNGLVKAAKAYCDRWNEFSLNGKGLMFYGSCGTGKTFLAACIANRLIDNGVQVRFTTLSKIAAKLQSCYDAREEIYDELRTIPLLIIDDFRAERQTEFMQEITFEVINGRSEARRPLIVTTNLTNEDIKAPKDITSERIISRLIEMTVPLEVTGEDKRALKARSEYAYNKAMLYDE